jgi:hypothetical protein
LGFLAVCERLALERDFATVRPFADLRLFDRLPELARDLDLGCCAMGRESFPTGFQKTTTRFQEDQSQIANFCAFPVSRLRTRPEPLGYRMGALDEKH